MVELGWSGQKATGETINIDPNMAREIPLSDTDCEISVLQLCGVRICAFHCCRQPSPQSSGSTRRAITLDKMVNHHGFRHGRQPGEESVRVQEGKQGRDGYHYTKPICAENA